MLCLNGAFTCIDYCAVEVGNIVDAVAVWHGIQILHSAHYHCEEFGGSLGFVNGFTCFSEHADEWEIIGSDEIFMWSPLASTFYMANVSRASGLHLHL